MGLFWAEALEASALHSTFSSLEGVAVKACVEMELCLPWS